ncbi:putative peroxiredoxin family protein [Desulforapulum autotrophicum HRM2]|jgi:peroxiredoxin|uniref:thioredoxin-dependent peroxiredoxin n=1 Tax=Desulforapulum autotrophicum (strain ATCC 43914 / DSM 3382 / VKM B-1955 / HRM2) TaxID=177437 RepID=C0Q945_DESAH|nr:peroxiredoxin-like family protein [Desulforapulum autotrophicum]ACN16550.1 putative peroxiredoxin family protein [Desulforapulum autotrophicum HRM2]
MSLKEQLTTLKSKSQSQIPEDIQKTMFDDLKKLGESGIIEGAPKTGEKLKDFTLSNHLGENKSLSELRKKGPVVVTFYRGGWCPYCNLELHAYQAVLQDIKDAGATLVAITPELPDESLTTSERHGLKFEVLTDTNSDYAREIGIVFTLSEELRSIYESFGIKVEKHNGKGQFDLPLAATFVVDTDGTIACAFVEADYKLRAEPSDVVNVLKTLVK